MLKEAFMALKPEPDDPILGLNDLYRKDARPEKVNLGVGVYLDEAGKLPLLPAVAQAEQRLVAQNLPRGYIAMSGLNSFLEAVRHLVFGAQADAVQADRIASIQTLAGTGALKLGATFMKRFLGVTKAYVSDPTWSNHYAIFRGVGLETGSYPYLAADQQSVDINAMKAFLATLDPMSVVVLHGCCHNPTGVDMTPQQWDEVIDIIKDKNLIAFIDMAYQGFGDGVDEDAYAIRALADKGCYFLAATSCSKNFGLYGERIGALHVTTADATQAATVLSILKTVVRSEYSNPPIHGAVVVKEILTDEALRNSWLASVDKMRARILKMRKALYDAALAEGVALDFVLKQKGMFSFTGLTPEEMDTLRVEHAIYGVRNGRICVAGLNDGNVVRVAKAIASIIKAR